MEAMLKHLLAHSNVQGCASELAQVLNTRVASYAKQPMGRLADVFVKSTCSSSVKTVEGPEDLAEPWVSFSFQLESGGDVAKERKRALKHIVEERNRLIHQKLVQFDHSSIESCVKLSKELDIQNANLMPEYRLLQSLVNCLKDAQQELVTFIQSDERGKVSDQKKDDA
jgi:hypothetical protein